MVTPATTSPSLSDDVQYSLLRQVIDQEGPHFYSTSRRWQPKDLIPDPYRRNLLKDAMGRYAQVSEAEPELQTLDRSHKYIELLRRMRLAIKAAQFAWRSDDLKFLQTISDFFQDYGTILRFLKEDDARGLLVPSPTQPSGV